MREHEGSEAASEAAEETGADRRRHERVSVNLPGRYMLEDGSEHPCVCVDISVSGVRLRAAQAGAWGSRVVAYVESIGRVEGHIVRRAPGWFALAVRATARKGERVQERIEAILKSHAAESDRRREGGGREWVERAAWLYTLDGRRHEALVTDISKGGAALLTEARLEADERVRLDSKRARVARVFPGGAALKFENWVDESWPPRDAPEPAAERPRAAAGAGRGRRA